MLSEHKAVDLHSVFGQFPLSAGGAVYSQIGLCEWLKRRLIPTLRGTTILCLDNLPVHKSKRVRELCRMAGIILFFLPRYSPEWNPIEKFFSKLKSVLRRLQPRIFEAVRRIVCRVARSVEAAECINYIKAAGYNV